VGATSAAPNPATAAAVTIKVFFMGHDRREIRVSANQGFPYTFAPPG
jgi:hypothetical protein